MKRYVAYLRCSTQEQADSGASIEAQRRAIEGWQISQADAQVTHWCADEGVSGATLERPGFREAMQLVSRGDVDGLVILKLDRLTRSVADFLKLVTEFTDQECALVSVRDNLDTESANGRMVATILATISEWERRVISERTKEALAVKRSQGVRLGRPPALDARQVARLRELWPTTSMPELVAEFGVSQATLYRAMA